MALGYRTSADAGEDGTLGAAQLQLGLELLQQQLEVEVAVKVVAPGVWRGQSVTTGDKV